MKPIDSKQAILNLAGEWCFQLDSLDVGETDEWFKKELPLKIKIPGSLQENGYGNDISVNTQWTGRIVDKAWYTDEKYKKYRQPGNVKIPFWLQPEKHYVGKAWYQKEVNIPESWAGKQIVLSLERCHWETRLWVDETEIGSYNSLSVPHLYELSEVLTPGKRRITICVDNRVKIDVGLNAHSVSDQTQSNWNGFVGNLVLYAVSPVFVEDVKVFPDLSSRSAHVQIHIQNLTGSLHQGEIIILAESFNSSKKHHSEPLLTEFEITGRDTVLELNYPLGTGVLLWDEFHPNLYKLKVELKTEELSDTKIIQFGMREFKVSNTRFTINGRPVFLRGTLECAIFPKTGYPSTEVKEWKRIFSVCRDHGLNHMRFHSWCPPEAAFDAADQMGIYLHVECAAWCEVGSGKQVDKWLYERSERIVKNYGNHPSFCMMAYGNEPRGRNREDYLGKFVNYWKAKDNRRVYTSGAGWPSIPENDYHSSPGPRIGGGLRSIINREAPQTMFDFADILKKYGSKPVVSHEIGQWCVYPNFKEIEKYSGVLKAKNFEIFQETLEANHLGDLGDDFLMASGKLQALCYKADIEVALRTPGFAGFQLLDLHDFPGQGTALVGVVDAFWEEKGYISPEEFSRFCDVAVPLARMEKRCFLNNEHFEASIEIAHFGESPLLNVTPIWTITDKSKNTVTSGTFNTRDIPIGNNIPLGKIDLPLNHIEKAVQYNLNVKIGMYENDWDFWVYPQELPVIDKAGIFVTQSLEEAESHLQQGEKVLLTVPEGTVKLEKGGSITVGFSSIFWNTSWFRNRPPHTLGILCDPGHPALAEFPTEYHSN